MNNKIIAQKLNKIAKELSAIDFPYIIDCENNCWTTDIDLKINQVDRTKF